MFKWFRRLFKPAPPMPCEHVHWPVYAGHRLAGLRCIHCGHYKTMEEVYRKAKV